MTARALELPFLLPVIPSTMGSHNPKHDEDFFFFFLEKVSAFLTKALVEAD